MLGQPDSAAGGTWPEQQQASTEVGQFEPLPDSPTGGRTAAGRGFDQQRQVSAELQQQPAAEVVKKLPPIQDAPRVIRQVRSTMPLVCIIQYQDLCVVVAFFTRGLALHSRLFLAHSWR